MDQSLNLGLVTYIEQQILPMYNGFDKAHSIEHARKVIADSLALASSCGVDANMAYAIAAYHDTGMVEGRETHHLGSGKIVMADKNLRQWFSEEQILVIKEAVEDHRASGKNEPRSIYGKIVADADREIANYQPLRRTILFGKKNYPSFDKEGHYVRFREHVREKYGVGGYLKLWIPNTGKAEQLRDLQTVIADEQKLRQIFDELWDENR